MALVDLIPGPINLILPQLRAFAAAVDARGAQDYVVSEYATFAAAVADMPGTGATLVINTPFNVTADITIPAHVTLRFTHKGSLNITTGEVLTILGPIQAGPTKIFLNALSGQGTVSFAGNKAIDLYKAAWWGVVGDGVSGSGTDNTATLQRIFDTLFTDGVEATLRLPKGEVIIAGALQDTSLSNSQIVLPKRTLAQTQYNLVIEGASDPSMLGLGVATSGTVLRSTLSSGTGAMIGVKTSGTLGTSALNLTLRNLTFRMPANPTNSALDLSYVMQPRGFNLRFTTGEIFNAWTEPTTTSSCAMKMPLVNVPSTSYFENVVIDGFFIGADIGELSRFENLTIAGCYRALNVHANIHKAHLRRVLAINNRHVIYAPDTSPTTFAWVDIDIDIERATTAVHGAVWFVGQDEINDLADVLGTDIGYLNGPITTHLDLPFGAISDALIVNGGAYAQINHYRPYTPTWTNLTVGSGTAEVMYLKRNRQTFVRGHFKFGAGSAVSGDVQLTLPVPCQTHAGTTGFVPVGSARARDISAGTAAFVGVVTRISDTVVAVRFYSGSPAQEVTAASLFTWATDDELNFEFSYESEW